MNMDYPTFSLTDATGDSTGPVVPTAIEFDTIDTVTTATDPTHLTIDAIRPCPNVLTDAGRHRLRTESHMTEDEIDAAVAKLKTVTLTAPMNYRGYSCSHVFDDLSEVSKTNSLQLESLMIRHVTETQSYDRRKLMNPYRLCVDDLPIRAKSYIVLNDYEFDHLPTTFIISTPARSSGDADTAALTFAGLCKFDQESIHFGLLEQTKAKLRRKLIEGGVVPDSRYLSTFANLATETAPRSVTLVDVLVNEEGSPPQLDVYNIDEERAREAIQARLRTRPVAAARQQREGGVGTEYCFVDRETFNASHEGQVLAAHLSANEAK